MLLNIQERVFSMKHLILLFCCAVYSAASLAEIRLIRPLDFGTVVVVDNATVGFLNINQQGGFSASNHFMVISPSQFGIVELYDYYPGSQVDITANVIQSTSTSPVVSPEKFTLTNVYIVNLVSIDPSGIAQVRFGGRLETSGSGRSTFADTQYTHRIQISVNF